MAKSLKTNKKPPKKKQGDPIMKNKFGVRLSKNVIPGSKVIKTDSGVQVQTTMPDGLVVGWAQCGVCHLSVSRCHCSPGAIHTSGVEWIYVRVQMKRAKSFMYGEPKIDYRHPEVQKYGIYWYAAKRPKGAMSSFLLDRPTEPLRKLKSVTKFPPTKISPLVANARLRQAQLQQELAEIEAKRKNAKPIIKPNGKKSLVKLAPKTLSSDVDVDLKKIDAEAARDASKRLSDVYKKLDTLSKTPKKKKPKKKGKK